MIALESSFTSQLVYITIELKVKRSVSLHQAEGTPQMVSHNALLCPAGERVAHRVGS